MKIGAEEKTAAATALPLLTQLLASHDWWTRQAAAVALGNLGSGAKPATAAIEGLLHDNDADVRQAAGDALSKIR